MTGHRYDPTTARAASSKARATLTPEQRTERAKKAAAARWAKERPGWEPPDDDVTLAPFYALTDERWPGLPPAARTAAAQALRAEYGRQG